MLKIMLIRKLKSNKIIAMCVVSINVPEEILLALHENEEEFLEELANA